MEEAEDTRKSGVMAAVRALFRPEFINRIDDVVVFKSLEREHIHAIIDLELKALVARIEGLGYGIEITKKAKDFLVEEGYDEKYGARPLKRAIQKFIEDPFAEEIINAQIEEGDLLKADHKKGAAGLKISVVKGGFLSMPDGAQEALNDDVLPEESTSDEEES